MRLKIDLIIVFKSILLENNMSEQIYYAYNISHSAKYLDSLQSKELYNSQFNGCVQSYALRDQWVGEIPDDTSFDFYFTKPQEEIQTFPNGEMIKLTLVGKFKGSPKHHINNYYSYKN